MNKEMKDKLNNFIAKHIIVIRIIFVILFLPVSMGILEIKFALGIPNIDVSLDNKNSLLPDQLINKNDLNSNWKFRFIHTYQIDEKNDEKLTESAFRTFTGKYYNQGIVMFYSIYHYKDGLNMADERIVRWNTTLNKMNGYSTIELLQTFYNPVLDIQTYCYNYHYSDKSKNYTECSMYKFEGQNLIRARFGFFDITDMSVCMKIMTELERIME